MFSLTQQLCPVANSVQSNSGEACTCVVAEYRYHDADDFVVKIQAFSDRELRGQFQEMVRNFREHRNNSEQMDRDERRRSEELSNLARDTLSVMFPGRYSPALLMTGNEDAVVNTLLGWAQQRGAFARNRSETRQSREECSDLLVRLTSEGVAADGPAVWPYIKKIRCVTSPNLVSALVNPHSVRLRAHILSRGLVLVDLPGDTQNSNCLRCTDSAKVSVISTRPGEISLSDIC